jgi:hypothetical protein
MKIGFLSNQLDARGTGNALFNYAKGNIDYLGNDSKIFTLPGANHSRAAIEKFVNQFGNIYTPTFENLADLDALYHIKSGENDGFDPGIPYLIHAVFNAQVHGTRYAAISEWQGIRDNIPFVPHIINLADHSDDFRALLKIPDDAVVFGRHGGYDTFDIPWVWDAIREVLTIEENIYFLFLNTAPVIDHPRVMHFSETVDENAKRAFLNTCTHMLHARNRGETFGISVGEFAALGKPVITYKDSYEKAHIYELRGTALTYSLKEELISLLLKTKRTDINHPFYDKYTPENVMTKFKEVFLD